MDVTPEEVIKCFSSFNTLTLIHGHTHRPAVHNVEINNELAKRIVLGDWYEQGSILKVQPNKMELIVKHFTHD